MCGPGEHVSADGRSCFAWDWAFSMECHIGMTLSSNESMCEMWPAQIISCKLVW